VDYFNVNFDMSLNASTSRTLWFRYKGYFVENGWLLKKFPNIILKISLIKKLIEKVEWCMINRGLLNTPIIKNVQYKPLNLNYMFDGLVINILYKVEATDFYEILEEKYKAKCIYQEIYFKEYEDAVTAVNWLKEMQVAQKLIGKSFFVYGRGRFVELKLQKWFKTDIRFDS
jgi:hypothetical protein